MKYRMGSLTCLAVGCAALVACVAVAQSGGQPGQQTKAQITVVVPPNAEVFFDGQPTAQTGAQRVYLSPPLTAGQNYYYTVLARWQAGGRTVEQTRKVELTSDARVRVDFLTPPGQQAAQADQPGRTSNYPPAQGVGNVSEKEAMAIAVDAYVYGYPLVTMEMTRRVMTNRSTAEGARGPMGRFVNLREYPTAAYRDVTAPNADTLYSSAWLDVGKEPYVLSIPDENGRYYLMPMLSAWTDVFADPGTRTTGTGAQKYAITGPHWKGTLPEGVKELKSPTSLVWVLGRTYCTGTAEDYKAVHAIQDQYSVVPLSAYGKPYTPPPGKVDPSIDMKTPVRDQVNALKAGEYFGLMANLMKDNPPTQADAPFVARLQKIGIVPGQDFDIQKVDPAVARGLEAGVKPGLEKIMSYMKQAGKFVNGWVYPIPGGVYGTDYVQRATVAYYGLGCNRTKDAVYPTSETDAKGQHYTGANRYTMTFPKGQLPPVDGFWSLTMYDGDFFFVANPLNRYTLSQRNKLKANEDGSVTLYMQNESPGADKESNWLPAPKDRFVLMLRMYWPKERDPSILDSTWQVPPVRIVAK
jgi:uncharacterized protein (TIGR03000 family)